MKKTAYSLKFFLVLQERLTLQLKGIILGEWHFFTNKFCKSKWLLIAKPSVTLLFSKYLAINEINNNFTKEKKEANLMLYNVILSILAPWKRNTDSDNRECSFPI